MEERKTKKTLEYSVSGPKFESGTYEVGSRSVGKYYNYIYNTVCPQSLLGVLRNCGGQTN
jgi:hypothetical protein